MRPTTVQVFVDYLMPFMGPVKEAGLFPAVCIAQAGLETGWGLKKLELQPNFWGRKHHYGKGINSMTREVEEGENVFSERMFQYYETVEEAVQDYIRLFYDHPKFKGRVDLTSLESFVASMGPLYATDAPEDVDGDPSYSQKIMSIIVRYDLADL